MKKETYDDWMRKKDHELFGFAALKAGTEEHIAANHILEMRRSSQAVTAARLAAIAAWGAVAVGILQLIRR
jgi:hypothetical protein